MEFEGSPNIKSRTLIETNTTTVMLDLKDGPYKKHCGVD